MSQPLDLAAMQAPNASTSLKDAWQARLERWYAHPGLYRWSLGNPFTRWLTLRRTRKLFDLMAGFVHSQVLLSCVRLKLFEHVLQAPRTADELATLCRLPTAQLARLLDSAVALHLLEQRGSGRYGLGPMGAPVVAHAGIRDMIEHNAVLYEDMRDPLALLREPNAARMHAYWPYTEDPAGNPQAPAPVDQFARYSSLMSTSQRFVIEELLSSYAFNEHRVVLDVGGGMGGWVSALALRHPHLQLQLFDLPPVAALAADNVQRQGLSDRISTHGGSFTQDALPRGADLVTLVRVAHDHPDGDVRVVLRAIFDALPLGGALLLAEPMAQAGGAPEPSDPYFHFYLMAMGSGRLRTPAELTALMVEAGFTHIERVPNPMPLHAQLLVGRKARGLPGTTRNSVNFS